MKLPDGYRLLKPGEIIERDDLYLSTSGSWQPTPISGIAPAPDDVVFARKETVADKILTGLQEFTDVLESGEPLEDHFRVTRLERQEDGSIKRTVSEPRRKHAGSD